MALPILAFIVIGIALLLPILVVLVAAYFRNKKYPEKTYKHNVINVALTPVRYFRLGPFKAGKLDMRKACEYAIKKTGLKDFGGSSFISTTEVLMKSPTHSIQRFSNLGYISSRIELNMNLVRRLKFIDYLKKNSDVLSVPLREPVFVMGLPRTGTTFIHRLLSLDPKVRAPLLWELLAPVPSVAGNASEKEFNEDLKKRCKFIKKLVDTRLSMGDNAMMHIHEIGHDLPEECIMALSDEIPVNLQFLYTAYLESKIFFDALEGNVINDAYVYYRKVLQLLSYQIGERSNPRRWVLKCPIHLFFPKAIAKAFPDAKLIWTHRHPVSAVPSLCSLLKSLHQVYFETEGRDDFNMGQQIHKVSSELLTQAPKDIVESGLECAHVIYNDLVADSVGIIQSIYKQFGWEYSDEYDQILRKYLDDNLRKREEIKREKSMRLKNNKKEEEEKLHTYEPEEFGLTAELLSDGEYAKYAKAFNVPMSKN